MRPGSASGLDDRRRPWARAATRMLRAAGRVTRVVPEGIKRPLRTRIRRFYASRVLLRPTRVRGSLMVFGRGPEDADRYYVAASTMIAGEHEPVTSALFERVLEPGMTVVDVGAHVGYYSLLAARRTQPGGTVLAFEPEPTNFEVLQRNMALNQYTALRVFQMAVSGSSGRVRFNVSNDSGAHSLLGNRNASGRVVDVEATSLDEFLPRQGVDHVDLLKLDAEGAEPDILRGARSTIARTDRIVMEFLPQNFVDAGLDPSAFARDVAVLARTEGFDTHILDDEGGRTLAKGEDLAALVPALLRDRIRNYVYVYLARTNPRHGLPGL